MSYIPQTPFRRAVSYVPSPKVIEPPQPEVSVNKWDALRAVGTARKHLGLSDRTVGVLQALISFHRTDTLHGGEVIFASNATICKRLNGMPCSTMRRHLAQLVDAGLLLRRDSPNGKRYVRTRGPNSSAFGFDISPLAARYPELLSLAAKADREEEMIKGLRQEITLMKRDIIAFIETRALSTAQYDQNSDFCRLTTRQLRRKLTVEELEQIHGNVSDHLQKLRDFLIAESAQLSTNDVQNEHHCSSPNKYLELATTDREKHQILFAEMKERCPEIALFGGGQVNNWDDLYRAACKVYPMIGLQRNTWETAVKIIGAANSAIVVSVMLEKFTEIRCVNSYVHGLIKQGRAGTFCTRHFLNSLSAQSSQL
jgi:replication initiation protein RepC